MIYLHKNETFLDSVIFSVSINRGISFPLYWGRNQNLSQRTSKAYYENIMKFLCLLIASLVCLHQSVGNITDFSLNDFRMVLDYMKDIYREKAQDTANKKWFNTEKHAYGYVAYDSKQRNIVVMLFEVKKFIILSSVYITNF